MQHIPSPLIGVTTRILHQRAGRRRLRRLGGGGETRISAAEMDLTDEELSGVEQAGGEVELAGGAGGGVRRGGRASGKWEVVVCGGGQREDSRFSSS